MANICIRDRGLLSGTIQFYHTRNQAVPVAISRLNGNHLWHIISGQ